MQAFPVSCFVFGLLLTCANLTVLARTGCTQDHAQPPEIDWLEGKARQQALRLPISVNWVEAPLRERLQQLSQRQRLPVFVDRRVDPDQLVTLTLNDVTFEQLLWKVADHLDLAVCKLDDLYYVGPKSSTDALPLFLNQLRTEIRNEGSVGPEDRKENARASQRRLRWGWPSLSEPRQIASQISLENPAWAITNPEQIPHDIWPEFPTVSLSRDVWCAITVYGFGKWLAPVKAEQGKYAFAVTDLGEIGDGQIEVRNIQGGTKLLKQARNRFPNCKIARKGNSFTLSGSPLAIANVHRFLIEQQQPDQTSDEQARFDLKTTATRKAILVRIARQLEVELKMPNVVVFEQRIPIDVQQVTLEQLIVEVLKDSEHSYRLSETELEILPR